MKIKKTFFKNFGMSSTASSLLPTSATNLLIQPLISSSDDSLSQNKKWTK
jgi:hypothetical protein